MTLTEMRRSKDMSLGEMARACNLGTAVMSRIERGLIRPPDAVIQDIARVLSCTSEEVSSAIPSQEEAEKDYTRLLDSLLAISACHEDAKTRGLKKGNGGYGEIDCPICKGRLRYSVASVNGHLWGACSNPDCVRWMQ